MSERESMRVGASAGLLVALLAGAVVVAALPRATLQAAQRAARPAPVLKYDVVKTYAHDPAAYTQGLIFRDGYLFESTGLHGQSSLRKVRLETGEIVQRREIDKRYFGEGLTDWGGKLLQLTWETNIGFVYDLSSFAPVNTFTYAGEGWGLAQDGKRLIMSDGTSELRFLDPETQRELSRIRVRDGDRAVDRLNELEVVNGEIYANVYVTDRIAIIAPDTGTVTAWLDLAALKGTRNGEDVLNGIAYDAAGHRLFVTGKLWSRLYEIRVRR
jgi:glutaminyl-peptide cyclotransferase